jgi:polyisoprenoid-binding protein YceI
MATYQVDKSHSEVGFTARHMVFAKVHGQFKDWSATLAYDPADPTRSSVKVEVVVASIHTGEEKRDGHLLSPDFFDAGTFPTMVFQSKRVEATSPGHYKVVGDLTLHGTTHELALAVEETGRGKDPWGNERIGFGAKGMLSRSEFGLTWNQALETGGLLVGDKVEIEVETQVVVGK